MKIENALERTFGSVTSAQAQLSPRSSTRGRSFRAADVSATLVNQCSFPHSSRKRPLNDSMSAFCIGLPGSIGRSVTPRVCAHVDSGANTSESCTKVHASLPVELGAIGAGWSGRPRTPDTRADSRTDLKSQGLRYLSSSYRTPSVYWNPSVLSISFQLNQLLDSKQNRQSLRVKPVFQLFERQCEELRALVAAEPERGLR